MWTNLSVVRCVRHAGHKKDIETTECSRRVYESRKKERETIANVQSPVTTLWLALLDVLREPLQTFKQALTSGSAAAEVTNFRSLTGRS